MMSGTVERASLVNSCTAVLAPESINRNRPISIARFFPLSRIAVSPVVSRSAIVGISAAALSGPSERRRVSIALISATVRGRT